MKAGRAPVEDAPARPLQPPRDLLNPLYVFSIGFVLVIALKWAFWID